MSAELYLLLAIVSSSSITVILKIFSDQRGNRYGLLLGNYLTCIVIALSGVSDRRSILSPGRDILILGVISGVLFVAGLVATQNAIRTNGASLAAAFAKLGLIVPLTVSMLLFGERPRLHQALGIGLVFLAIFIIHRPGQEKEDAPQLIRILPLITVLIICGCGDATIKIFEHSQQSDYGNLFFFYLFGSAACITFVLLCLEYRRTGLTIRPKEFAAGILVGIPNYYASALLLKALVRLPAIIVYPCYSTGTILLVLLISSAFLRERITRQMSAGLLVILAALVLLNL